ncbi:MAG: aldo/keto reductase [Anaerolineae bacterium]|nr:aldo/keto reductase [Anaerolineae bacterium]
MTKTLTLPQTDLTVSQVCLGSSHFGSSISQSDVFRLLDSFVDHGGNFIDTARVYADWLPNGANASERTIGEWQRQRGNRAKIVLATKGAHPDLKTMTVSRLSPADIAHDIETSLRYLQTDVIDLYWLHRDDANRPVEDILETLNKHVALGNIRYFGCSNWTVPRIRAALAAAEASHSMGFVANQPMWSLAKPNLEAIGDKTIVIADDVDIAFHRETGLPLVPFTSQAKGYFSKLAAGRVPPADQKTYDNATNRVRFARIRELSERYHVSVSAIALSYLTSQPFPVVPVIGASKLAQLEDSLANSDLVLTPDDLNSLEQVIVQ